MYADLMSARIVAGAAAMEATVNTGALTATHMYAEIMHAQAAHGAAAVTAAANGTHIAAEAQEDTQMIMATLAMKTLTVTLRADNVNIGALTALIILDGNTAAVWKNVAAVLNATL
jgi:hypothetical protein